MFNNEEFLTMTDMVSHEFKTPLAVIRSNISNIERRYEEGRLDTMDMRKATMAIRYCCNSLSRLSNNMSLVSGKKKFVADRYCYDVTEQINSLCFIASELFDENKVEIKLDPQTPSTIFSLDPDYMVGIILNLISNGIKYNTSDHKKIDISLEVKDEKLHIWVKDNGIGFPQKEAEKIFDSYYRADNSSVMMASGLGLGLFIVREEVKAHNGTITATSTKEGTTFEIIIPDNDKLIFRSPRTIYVSKDTVELGLSDELLKFM